MAALFNYLLNLGFKDGMTTATSQGNTTITAKSQSELLSRPRKMRMRVLALSLCRTGELSLGEALKILGYTPFGMADNTKNPAVLLPAWKQAVDAKYFSGPGKKWGKQEFDGVLSDYDAVIGVPTCLFADELIDAYPDAKVIVTKKEKKSWLKSMYGSAVVMVKWSGWDFMIKWDPGFSGPLLNLIRSQMRVMCNLYDVSPNGHASKFYEDHERKLRERVPSEKLLEFSNEEGWEPLCKFLNEPIPRGIPFPIMADDLDDERIQKFQRGFWYLGMGRAILRAGIYYAFVPTVLLFGWRYQDMLAKNARSASQFLQYHVSGSMSF